MLALLRAISCIIRGFCRWATSHCPAITPDIWCRISVEGDWDLIMRLHVLRDSATPGNAIDYRGGPPDSHQELWAFAARSEIAAPGSKNCHTLKLPHWTCINKIFFQKPTFSEVFDLGGRHRAPVAHTEVAVPGSKLLKVPHWILKLWH